MDTSKILLILCTLILIVCLTLATSTLMVFRNAIDENEVMQDRAASLVDSLSGCVDVLNEVTQENAIPVVGEPDKNETNRNGFLVCEVNGKICVYTTDGYLVKTTEITTSQFPTEDRTALAQGISCVNWQAVLAVLQDYST